MNRATVFSMLIFIIITNIISFLVPLSALKQKKPKYSATPPSPPPKSISQYTEGRNKSYCGAEIKEVIKKWVHDKNIRTQENTNENNLAMYLMVSRNYFVEVYYEFFNEKEIYKMRITLIPSRIDTNEEYMTISKQWDIHEIESLWDSLLINAKCIDEREMKKQKEIIDEKIINIEKILNKIIINE